MLIAARRSKAASAAARPMCRISSFPAVVAETRQSSVRGVIPSRSSNRTNLVILGVRAGWFAGDHGMNQPFWPLTCFFTLATLVALSGDASALPRHKQIQHGKKTDAAIERRHPGKVAPKKVALKKARHKALVAAARRKVAPSAKAPAQEATTP